MTTLSTIAALVALDPRLATVDRRLVLELLSREAQTDFTWMPTATERQIEAFVSGGGV